MQQILERQRDRVRFELSETGRSLTLSHAVIGVMDLYRQMTSSAQESGGVLLGRIFDGSGDYVINLATTPVSQDRRSRFSFWRAREPAQRAVDAAWALSNGEANYLGEWHTHPEDDPHPSQIDLANWKRIGREVRCEHDVLVFVIVGRLAIRAWALSRSDGKITSLMPAVGSAEARSLG